MRCPRKRYRCNSPNRELAFESSKDYAFTLPRSTANLAEEISGEKVILSIHLVQKLRPQSQQRGLFINARASDASQSIERLLLRVEPVWRDADITPPDSPIAIESLHRLRSEARTLDQAFAEWQEAQVKSVQPWPVGHISQGQNGSNVEIGLWPGRVDAYFDLYIAYIWNMSRAVRLFLIDLIIKISQVLCDGSDYAREIQVARRLTEDMLSSVPFHLAEDLQIFLRDTKVETPTPNIDPGRAIGGLLLMHPIYIASKLEIVPQQMQNYLIGCLEWIATNMGIGQASRLAKVRIMLLEETPALLYSRDIGEDD